MKLNYKKQNIIQNLIKYRNNFYKKLKIKYKIIYIK